MNKSIRILLVDDYEVYRNGLRSMLDGQDDIEVVGECPTEIIEPKTEIKRLKNR